MREFGRRLEKETIPGRFVSKLNDAETEAAETQVHVEIAFRQSYLKQEVFDELDDACDKILAQIVKMIDRADRWVIKSRPDPSPHENVDTLTRRTADTSLLKPRGNA
jgi:hypothetical protein